MELLQNEVGLQLKLSKGQLTLSQHFKCLGFMWNTVTMRCSVPPKRIKGLQLTALRLLRMSATSDDVNDIAVPTRDLARFHGLATSCTRAIHPARRRLIYIQHTLSQAVSKRGWRGSTTLSPMTRRALEWWTIEEVCWLNNVHDIVPPPRPIQRGDSQRRIWRGNALRGEGFSHPGFPHSDGTSRNPHQSIRVQFCNQLHCR
jgi:hypothetical protein